MSERKVYTVPEVLFYLERMNKVVRDYPDQNAPVKDNPLFNPAMKAFQEAINNCPELPPYVSDVIMVALINTIDKPSGYGTGEDYPEDQECGGCDCGSDMCDGGTDGYVH